MFVTLDKILSEGKPCKEGLSWFKRWFPEGGEMCDIINHKYVNLEFLHWGYTHLASTEEEKDLYWKKVGVDDESKRTCYLCDDITKSHYISRSSHIEDSDYVFSSISVFDSELVSSSKNVENSGEIYNSEFVEDCRRISNCRNTVRSNTVVASSFVIDSKSVVNSSVVTNSMCVGGLFFGSSKKIDDCAFIDNCENIQHCLFCSGQKDAKYLLFNQPVEPMQFEMIKKQLERILGNWNMRLVEEWPEMHLHPESPKQMHNVSAQYCELPETFWRWVVTLPNYNPEVLYAITMQDKLLTE